MPGHATDWAEISVLGDPDIDGELLRIKFNVSWLLSSWRCIFGQGCPGVLISGAMEDRGCCQIGVHLSKGDDYNRVKGFVDQLTDQDLDADLLAEVHRNGWSYKDTDRANIKAGHTRHTRVVDGACILANRATGSTGKIGCSLHVLADRLGLHHSDTKPDICWQIPMSVTDEYDEVADQTTVIVDASIGHVWGETTPSRKRFPAWWCLETPDAYKEGDRKNEIARLGRQRNSMADVEAQTRGMVFRTNEVELRKMLGDREYEAMAVELARIVAMGGRRSPMAGETVARGRPLIPLIVADRVNDWANDSDSDTQQESREALERSAEYIMKHGIVVELDTSNAKAIDS